MRQKQPSNLVALLLSLIPGAGHVYLDHAVRGALVFAGWATCLNGVFLGSILKATEYTQAIRDVSLAGLILIWLGSVWHIYKQSYGTDRRSLAQHRELLLRSALEDYLRDELGESVRKLEQAISLDVDWQDPDPLFHLGVVMLRLAERHVEAGDSERARAARRRSQWAFRTCLARDSAEKWRAEIARESKRMRHLLRLTGRPRVTPTGKLPDVFDETGEFPELRSSGRIPRARLLEGLRDAVEDTTQGRGLGGLGGSAADLPRTRRASRPFSSAELARRVATDRRDRPQRPVGPPPTRVTARLKPVERPAADPSAPSSEERAESFPPGIPATRKSTRPHDSESLRRAVESGEIQGSATRKRLMAESPTDLPSGEDPPRRRLSSERLTRRYRAIKEDEEPAAETGAPALEPLPSPEVDPAPTAADQEGRGSSPAVDNGALDAAPSASGDVEDEPQDAEDGGDGEAENGEGEPTEDVAGAAAGDEVAVTGLGQQGGPESADLEDGTRLTLSETSEASEASEAGEGKAGEGESGESGSAPEESRPAKARAGRGASS